jgi:hypothetical protein
MNFDAEFPLKFYLNLNKQDDRRRKVLNALLDHGMADVERIPAVDGRWVKHPRGYTNANRYAQALTHKMAVWRARQRKAPAVLVFEDDVVFAADLRARLAEIALPEDWGIFFLGCQHLERPDVVSPGLVKCARTWDMHAYAVHARYYTAVMRILTATKGKPARRAETCDTQLQLLQKEVPCYAAWPNLAWQPREVSYAAGGWKNDNYLTSGRQAKFLSMVAGLDEEMAEKTGKRPAPVPRKRNPWLNWQPANAACGLGDRMRSLAAMLAVAAVRGQTLRLLWQPHEACPGKHDDVLEANGYVVVDDAAEWERLTRGQECEQSVQQFHTISQAWEQLTAGGGPLTESGEDAASMEARWRRMARRLRVRTDILRRADELQHGWTARRLLGLHVRRTDILKDPNKGITEANQSLYDQALLERARQIAAEGRTDGILLACDNPVSAAEWTERLISLGRPVFQSEKSWNPSAMRQSSLEEAMLDLLLLSRCERIIGSTYSSFAVLSAALGSVEYETVGAVR